MPFIKDLGQMEIDFSTPSSPADNPKMKKVFKKVRFPLSIVGDKLLKLGDMIVVVTVGKVKGVENTEHSKELTVEAMSGGVYMESANLESQIASAFGNKNTSHNSDHGSSHEDK